MSWDKETQAEKNEALEIIQGRVSQDLYDDIVSMVDEGGYTHSFSIEDKPKGTFQKEDCEHLEGVYVNQTTNGGMTGDEFAGTVSIEFDGQYLQFNYNL